MCLFVIEKLLIAWYTESAYEYIEVKKMVNNCKCIILTLYILCNNYLLSELVCLNSMTNFEFGDRKSQDFCRREYFFEKILILKFN